MTTYTTHTFFVAYQPVYLYIHERIHHTILFVGKAAYVSICTYMNAFTVHTQVCACVRAHTQTHARKLKRKIKISELDNNYKNSLC